MKYIAKSAFKQSNIMDKINKGCDGVEIQLLNPENEICLEKGYKIEKFLKDCNIVSIHTPLVAETDNNFNIETPCGKDGFIKSIELADKFSQFYGRRMNLVCHMDLSIKQQIELGIYEQTKEFLLENLEKYKNIDVNLENVTIRDMGVYDNVVLVKELNKENLWTTLDICHALMTESATGYFTSEGKYENEYYEYETLEKAFEKNKDVCKWIHLNNATNEGEGYGVGRGHGSIFNPNNVNDVSTLLKTLRFADTIGLENICIEVREDNYLDSQNFLQTMNLCKALRNNEKEFKKFIA